MNIFRKDIKKKESFRKDIKKKMKNKYLNKKAGISYLQILILFVGMFAFCHIISESLVSAQEEVCCERTTQDVWCQNTEDTNCNSEYRISPAACGETGFCEIGCCYDSSEGLCSARTNKAACSKEWFADELCNIPECEKACCLFGSNVAWATERECYKISSSYGLEGVWKQDIENELECILQTQLQKEGACVFEQEFEINCIFTTGQECKRLTGSMSNFHKGTLCSNPDLNTICERTHYTGCVEGKDGVYWFDSCNNRENIYSSNKIRSWNDGRVKDKNEICELNDRLSNADICGNCDYFEGSICAEYNSGIDITKPTYGDYVCRDLDCEVEIEGRIVEKKHGESWCEYDGAVGVDSEERIARDVVGSRHWRHVCIDGENILEPCADYRNEICIENEEEGVTSSACVVNLWHECLILNSGKKSEKKENLEKCEASPRCWVKDMIYEVEECGFRGCVKVEKSIGKVCVARVPPGFELKAEDTQESELSPENMCKIGKQKCTVLYEKEWGDWDCKGNCWCHEKQFTVGANELCVSIGDCGGYVNIEGKYTDEGYKIKEAPKLKENKNPVLRYISYATPIPGEKIEAGEFVNFNEDISGRLRMPGIDVGEYIYTNVLASAFAGGLVLWGATASYVAVHNVLVALKITEGSPGIFMASSTFISIAVLVIALLVVLSFFIEEIAEIFEEILSWFGFDSKERYVKYKCKPWQAPLGGEDCEKCGQDGKPCTKYRCESLGQACEIINEGTDQEMCFNMHSGDVASPVREPLLEFISEGHEYADIRNTGFQIQGQVEQCVQAFTNIDFGIKTDEPAVCRFSFASGKGFEEMEEDFDGTLGQKHEMTYEMPSVEALANFFEVDVGIVREKYGIFNLYVKCQDVMGNANENDYIIRFCVSKEPDKTPPSINTVIPESGSYAAYDETEKEIDVYASEPAECRWSSIDKDYNYMENSMECETGLDEHSLYGWICNTALTGLNPGNNLFYIRCKDNPWMDESERNAMAQSYNYILKKSESELSVGKIEPISGLSSVEISLKSGIYEILAGVDPVSIRLKAETSGGAENGRAICEWEEEGGWSDYFTETNSANHKSYALPLTEGNYMFDIFCRDAAGNSATGSLDLEVNLDTSPPIVTRAYYYQGKLKVMTNEDAVCGYSFDDCLFDVSNTNLMTGQEKEHNARWQANKNYYIKCKDVYGTSPEECNIIIQTYET